MRNINQFLEGSRSCKDEASSCRVFFPSVSDIGAGHATSLAKQRESLVYSYDGLVEIRRRGGFFYYTCTPRGRTGFHS